MGDHMKSQGMYPYGSYAAAQSGNSINQHYNHSSQQANADHPQVSPANFFQSNPQNSQVYRNQYRPQNFKHVQQASNHHVNLTTNSNYVFETRHVDQRSPQNFGQTMPQPKQQQRGEMRLPTPMNVNQNMHGVVITDHHHHQSTHQYLGRPAPGHQGPVQSPPIAQRPPAPNSRPPFNNRGDPSSTANSNQAQSPIDLRTNDFQKLPSGCQGYDGKLSNMKPQQLSQLPGQTLFNPSHQQHLPPQKLNLNPSEGADPHGNHFQGLATNHHPDQKVAASSPANGQQNQIPSRPSPLLQEVHPMLPNPLVNNEIGSLSSQPRLTNPSEGRRCGQDCYNEDDDDEFTDRSESYSTDSSMTSSSHEGVKKAGTPPPHHHHHQQVKKQATTKMVPHQQQYTPPLKQVPQSEYKTQSLDLNFKRLQIETNRACVDLLREHNIIADLDYDESLPPLESHMMQYNCPPDIMSSTLSIVPSTSGLLNKSRLPFGVLIHPLKDIQDLPESEYLVRCRFCRTYINPFVRLIDLRKWMCNICYRHNDLTDEFLYDHVKGSYTDGRHRPQMSSSCYEILTTPDQSVKNKHTPTYAFVIDVSLNAIETGYLPIVCEQILENLDQLEKDPNSSICFLTFDSHIQFYNLHHSLPQPSIYHVTDLEDILLPTPDGLLVNIVQSRDMIMTFLKLLPSMHKDNMETGNCLGVALKTVCLLLENKGGRVTVFQAKMPDVGEGSLKEREDPNRRACEDIQHLKPATDFYKNIAIECSSNQIGFDLFFLNSQYVDMASICPVAKFTGGCIEYFPNFKSSSNRIESERFRRTLTRYLTREVAFEAVLRIRCTRGLSFQMFHGNAFVRSTDLLSLPITNADAGFGVQVAISDTIEDSHACFQAALLYTNSRGERRLRVMNLCLKVSSDVTDILYNANQQAIVAFVAKMAVDRALNSSVKDSREALHNVALDMLEAFGKNLNPSVKIRQLPCPYLLRALPLFVFSLMKSTAFRLGISTKLDDRVFALEQLKTMPWPELLQLIYPHFYALHSLDEKNVMQIEDKVIYHPSMSSLTCGVLDRQGMFLLDTGTHMYLWMTPSINRRLLKDVLGANHFGSVHEGLTELPVLDNPISENIRNFIEYLNNLRQVPAPLVLIRDDSKDRVLFYERMVEDRTTDLCNVSYIEFLRTLQDKLTSS